MFHPQSKILHRPCQLFCMDLNGTRIYGKIIIIGKNWEHGNTFKLLYHTEQISKTGKNSLPGTFRVEAPVIELCVRSVAGEITLTHLVSVLREHSGEPGGREGAGGTFPGAAFSHSRLSQCPTLTPSYPHESRHIEIFKYLKILCKIKSKVSI